MLLSSIPFTLLRRYGNNLGDAHRCGIQKGAAMGAVIGFYGCINFTMYAVGMWYAGKFVRHDDMDVDEAIMVCFLLLRNV